MTIEYWAKKPYPNFRPPTVVEHCGHVREAVEVIWNIIATDLASILRIEIQQVEELRPLLVAAAILHDFAKVNSSFQQMLSSPRGSDFRQCVRHEILAAWLLSDDQILGTWFRKLRADSDTWPIIWAISGHHLKMVDSARPTEDPRHPSPTLFTLTNPPQLHIPLSVCGELFQIAADALGSSTAVPTFSDLTYRVVDDDDESLQIRIEQFANRSCRAWNKLRRDADVLQRTALLKALLISVDVAASAIVVDGRPLEWCARALRMRITPTELQMVIDADLKDQLARPFQQLVEASTASATLVVAGCGNGKTTAAYMWGKHHANGRKMWFTYPTTGTASAGFEDYLFAHKEIAKDLFHGRSDVDLVAMQDNGGTRQEDEGEEQARLESLRAWDRQVIVCTVDTVLGLMQSQRRPLFSFPALAAGAFVFDEIHSYDSRMFGILLRFLKTFPGAPVLLMSASIPPQRLEALKNVLGERMGDVIPGDSELEGLQRYRLEARESSAACHDAVKAALADNKKVLWVCNTVADAIKTAHDAEHWSGVAEKQIIVYHSRFRYRDRVERQNKVVTEFAYETESARKRLRAMPRGCLVITTQVCEMSLDISADLMVTAECPLPSLVQRLGRLNRYASSHDPWPCLVFPFVGDPYNEKSEYTDLRGDYRIEMNAMREVVRDFSGKACSQRDLAERLENMFGTESYDKTSAWLDDGWLSEPAPVRASGDTGVTVIREEDLVLIERELGKEHARSSRWTSRSLVPWTIPMNHSGRLRTNRGPAGVYPVAASGTIAYCEREGAAWQKNTN